MSARVIAIIVLLLLTGRAVAAADVSDVRIGVHPDKTRMVVELSEKVPYRIFTLQDPYRVVLDLPEVQWNIPETPKNPSVGIVTNYRFGLFQAGNSRLVVDLDKPAKLANHILLPATKTHPYRLVLDLQPVTDAEFAQAERQFAST